MAERVRMLWQASLGDGPGRAASRGGRYDAYFPDRLCDRPLRLPAELAARAYEVETDVRRLNGAPGAHGLEGLARFLLRSEAIASSRIEGLQVSAQQIALAELAQTDETVTRGFTATARLVANNITSLRHAVTTLADYRAVSIDGIDELHETLLPDEDHRGLRIVQNWIGGSDWHPIDAEYVPPPADRVPALMADLCDYINSGAHSALIQAALVHAQFETIHPYSDGNGRVGRALIHTVLVRRGLTSSAVLPISLVLLTRSHAYLNGLTDFRYVGGADSEVAHVATAAWIAVFIDAVDVAVGQAKQFGTELANLTDSWSSRLAEHREKTGLRGRPRADSATARLLQLLPELPVLTARSASRALGVSVQAAWSALEELAASGILHRKQVDRGATGFLAHEIFDVLTFAERRLASTRWDTRESRPIRVVPARPSS